MGTPDASIAEAAVRDALKGQYHAALDMLREAVELCPDELWLDDTPHNAFWRVAFHTLFFVHLYLLDGPDDFAPPEWHEKDVQNPDGMSRPADPASDLPVSPEPYTRSRVLEYWDLCESMVDERVDAMDIGSPTSGFYWYAISKLEHQIVNVRHTAYHAAQLADRIRAARDVGVTWVSSRRGESPNG